MKAKCCAFLVLCVTSIFYTVACSSNGTAPNGMTGAEILQMSQNASVNTVQFSDTAEINVNGGGIGYLAVGARDKLNKELYMTVTMPQTPEFNMFTYIVNGWLYMTDPKDGNSWIKTELVDEIWKNRDVTGQQMALIGGFFNATYVGMEYINEYNCYKIDVDPDWDAVLTVIGMSGTESLSTEDITDMIKGISCIAWVEENSYHTVRIHSSVTIDMSYWGETVRNETITFSHFNQTVDITLPSAALDATEMTYDEFMAGGW